MLTEKVNSAITDQMIRELRSRLQIGDLVQVLKWDGWKGQKRDESAARRIVCPIVGIYRNLTQSGFKKDIWKALHMLICSDNTISNI